MFQSTIFGVSDGKGQAKGLGSITSHLDLPLQSVEAEVLGEIENLDHSDGERTVEGFGGHVPVRERNDTEQTTCLNRRE